MGYIQGFVMAIPSANRDAFATHAGRASPLLREFGAARVVETWGDDVPEGKINDLHGAVAATADETVSFGWMEFPDKAARDATFEQMMSDPRMHAIGDMPFDGHRMIFGGFEPLVDVGDAGVPGYIDGFVLPVQRDNRPAYKAMAEQAAVVFQEHGAKRVVEAWGDDLPLGEVTDFARAAHAESNEDVVFAWIEWTDRTARDAGIAGAMADPRLGETPPDMPFDGKRLIMGGFEVLLVDAD